MGVISSDAFCAVTPRRVAWLGLLLVGDATHFPLRVQNAYERVVCQILGISVSPQATLQPAVQPSVMADVELFEGRD